MPDTEPRGLRERIEALADEWQRNAAANERAGQFPWAMWQRRANELRTALDETAAEPQPEPTPECGFNVGDTDICRCVLPRGHSGLHECKHTRPAPEVVQDDGEARMFAAGEIRDQLAETTFLDYGTRNRAAWGLVDWLTQHDADVAATALERMAATANAPSNLAVRAWLRTEAARLRATGSAT